MQQQILIQQLQQEVEQLKGKHPADSPPSSKPPSSDLLKKPEKPQAGATEETNKRKPGGQPGHSGKTRKGFGRVDRHKILRPDYVPVVAVTALSSNRYPCSSSKSHDW